ncbi:uncharacterized protein HLK63_D04103 [Nakaseomyces glabratus]|nr:uncharacterized protein GW608_D04103 [Nakaseomyces glabratus]UCS24796.1 uncharacterized protein HLK63_D04103 [Nakaseomyces glabratus]UCS30026.1 uncharacterized protein HLK64_D04103 [Nakaseomyces glabratus]UCS35254.1 uncharacterized protein HLK62_D04103 [Nakaseomyces glabratus]
MQLQCAQAAVTESSHLRDIDNNENVLYSIFEPFLPEQDDNMVDGDSSVCSVCGCHIYEKEVCHICDSVRLCDMNGYTLRTGDARVPLEGRVIVIDTICEEIEFLALKTKLIDFLSQIDPVPSLLISLHADGTIKIHGSEKIASIYVEHLRVKYAFKRHDKKYFMKLIDGIEIMNSYNEHVIAHIKALRNSVYTHNRKKRAKRATGCALFLANLLCKSDKLHYEVLSFLSGPCTLGNGKVISREVKNTIRQFTDLDQQKAKYFDDARSFYKYLAADSKSVAYGFYINCLDQIGIYEMSPLIKQSGIIYQFDSFQDTDLHDAFDKYKFFKKNNTIYDVKINVVTSPGIQWQKNHDIPLNWSMIFNKTSISIPIRLKIQDFTKEFYNIQATLEYTLGPNRYKYVKNAVIHGKDNIAKNIMFHNVLLASITKEIAWETLNEKYYSSQTCTKYREVILKRIAPRFKHNMDVLHYIYNLLRSNLLTTRNMSPDERVIAAHEIAYSTMEKIVLMIKPKILLAREADIEPQEVEITAELYADRHSMLGVDAGNLFLLRKSDDIDNNELRETIERWFRKRDTYSVTIIPLIEVVPGSGQDRFFKYKLIPMVSQQASAVHSEDTSFEEFVRQL